MSLNLRRGRDETPSDTATPSPSLPVVDSRTLRPGGGSFDFLGGSYEFSRRRARQRFYAIVLGSAVFILTGIFAGYSLVSTRLANESLNAARSQYTTTAGEYAAKTGRTPQTRSQINAALNAQLSALKLASTSSVDIDAVLAEVLKILPPGATVTSLSVSSWSDPKEAPTKPTASPTAEATPTYSVAFTVQLPPDEVSQLESNVAKLPFFTSQNSTTNYNEIPGMAQTRITVTSKTPLSSRKLQDLVEGGQ